MFGTIYQARVKPGREQEFLRQIEAWECERGARIEGPVAIYLFQSAADPREYNGVVVFDSQESYRANAADPEQHHWYEQLVELLEGPPIWMDGHVVHQWQAQDASVRGL